jgi:hypothetical protein
MENTLPIGGYFELSLDKLSNGVHPRAIALNTARNAFEYILKVKKIKKIYLPYFTCEVMLEPLAKLGIPHVFYCINEQLEPIFDFMLLKDHDAFLYTNYFGLKDHYVKKLSFTCKQLIVDNAQAFYAKSFNNEPTFYSARKYFGVADGAYLYCDDKLESIVQKDFSHDRMSHLLIRKDIDAEEGYSNFLKNENLLKNQPIRTMSTLTTAILESIDYENVAKKRIENFQMLKSALHNINQFSFELDSNNVPLVYPFWNRDKNLRQHLIKNKIYTATYWTNVKQWSHRDSLEWKLTDEVLYLPIDQRYGKIEIEIIINLIKEKI